MSELITIITLQPRDQVKVVISHLVTNNIFIDQVKEEFLEALWDRLGYRASAYAIHIYGEKNDGYQTSSVFIKLQGNEDQPAIIDFSDKFREDAVHIFETMMELSENNEVLMISELTYHRLGDDLKERYDYFPIEGPFTLNKFWQLHDEHCLFEQRIYEIIS